MPIYEYKCDDCGNDFEKLVRSASAGSPACPSCGHPRVTVQLSTFAAHANTSAAGSPEMPMGECPGAMCPNAALCGRN